MIEKSYLTSDGRTISYCDNEAYEKKCLVVLHGWGCDKDNLRGVYLPLCEDLRVISIDLPGFGKSGRPKETWGSVDYANDIAAFLKDIGVEKYSLFGHSFGGKIAFLISHSYPQNVEKLILMAANVLRNRHGLVWHWKVGSYKIAKFFMKHFCSAEKTEEWKKRFGSEDYKASQGMRDILVKEVNEDFSSLLEKVKTPVFLYWGKKDTATPIWMAKKLNRKLADCGMFVVDNGTHYPFLQDMLIVSIIKTFILD
jgi:pimeloyl-ACP methyl ester carboxylesterase